MKMVVAYIRHEAFETIRAELLDAGFPSLTIAEVKGSGRQRGITEHYRGAELAIHLRPKLRVEIVVEASDVDIIKSVILRHARTARWATGSSSCFPSTAPSASGRARRAQACCRRTSSRRSPRGCEVRAPRRSCAGEPAHPRRRYAAAGSGSGRTITVSAIAMISSAGRSAASACLRIASGLEAS